MLQPCIVGLKCPHCIRRSGEDLRRNGVEVYVFVKRLMLMLSVESNVRQMVKHFSVPQVLHESANYTVLRQSIGVLDLR